MLSWILATVCTMMLVGQTGDSGPASKKSPDTQPTSRPAEAPSTLRKPAQAVILKGLLGRTERPTPIQPQDPQTPGGGPARAADVDPDGQPLLLEGTLLVERPGRLVHEAGQAKFVFHVDADSSVTRTMEILPNQLLEAMEREAQAGFTEFIVTAELTRYKDRNYLMLRKILRRVGHGNLGPE
jgi:hypothetical protein